MISIMQPLRSVQMPIIKYKEFLCSLLTALPNQYLMLHRHWRINNLRIQRAKNYFYNVLHPFGTETYMFLLGNPKSIAMKPIYPPSKPRWFPPDFEASDDDDELSCLQNPTKTPIILKDFLRALPHCPTIHWASQKCNNPKICFCPCSISSQPWREKNNGKNWKIYMHPSLLIQCVKIYLV